MTKNSKKKSSTNESKNILYLHENDAKALGIVEGGVQRVFVDGREVDVTFVDEHEIIQMSPEEKKIYDEAEKIAQKYIQESQAEHENRRASRFGARDDKDASYINKRERNDRCYAGCECEKHQKHERVSLMQRLFGKKSSNDEQVEERRNRRDAELAKRNQLRAERQREMERREREKRDRIESSRELRTIRREEREEERRRNEVKRQEAANRRHRFQVRSDIFTEEELEILQGIISRSKSPSNASRKASSKSARR